VKIAFRESFARDLKSVRDKKLLRRVKEHIEAVESTDSPNSLPNLKKLKGPKNYFRLKLGDYRIGLALENNTFVFVRFLDRKDIYKYFP
jgi:mRNA interferase RelE/StbE